ncbi:ubiquitin-like protein Pup [Bifidobacterium apri]|uniref:Prokaryotic ubiquitin-like protein Pup n=1 Tax=Bifidobacterium apri TaxID=1769423 RepID=A0A6A2VVV2_9BIFI|nr:ubiquitin-like protein Pup [Bifidobacterium apri]KAB8300610.1 Pup-like protein [Bifidobacterium apri]
MPQEYAAQGQARQERRADEEHQPVERAQAQPQADALDQVLDDIAATLETNAQDYVSSFVQQGGQ